MDVAPPSRTSTPTLLLEAALFQGAWFACVLGAAHDVPLAAPLAALEFLALHLVLVRPAGATLGRVLVVAAVGCLGDALLTRVGALHLRGAASPWLGLPLWMLALWVAFGATFDLVLRRLRTRLRLAALLGLVGSPLSYLSAASLGALSFGTPRALALASTGLVWCVSLPLTLALSRRLDPSSDGDATDTRDGTPHVR
ncbi:MAG: DUF2878 domain-containing protein [Planctomycetes bacterium]|nr:DUF2878 domain-containing protein [Planctomycetota bacterium]